MTAADFRDAEDGFPAVRFGTFGFGGVVAEAGGGEGTLAPAAVNIAKVPVDRIGSSVAVKLVADVDEILHGC